MIKDFIELQHYIAKCKNNAKMCGESEDYYSESWWYDQIAQAEIDFLNMYNLEWFEYYYLEKLYKKVK